MGDVAAFDSYREVARAEWDTLLFFFGVIMCVGGLGFIGYLSQLSSYLYLELGPTMANILVGIFSSILDNIPIMVAVLQMEPNMPANQWLLVTLTAGVGGNWLCRGCCFNGAGKRYLYFFGHLKWMPVIALGHGLSIWVHLLINV